MVILPAIDLRGGRCVRLEQGDFQRETVFGDDPAAMAVHWVEQGAEWLHLVDLDGAREAAPANLASVEAILAAVRVPCQFGGGVRTEQTIEHLLSLGIERVVVGTRALEDPSWFEGVCRKFAGRVALGLDARGGNVATRGWEETTETPAIELARRFAALPVAAVVYTDIEKDGMLAGPNLGALAAMVREIALPIIASGGISGAEDVSRVAALGAAGCIVGRALYQGTVTLPEALEAARSDGPQQ